LREILTEGRIEVRRSDPLHAAFVDIGLPETTKKVIEGVAALSTAGL
jgi:hypothetical protein